jgi:hypothetical protein
VQLARLGQLDLSAPRGEAAVALAGLIDARRELEAALSSLDREQRVANEDVARVGAELARFEQRAAMGEAVASKERTALEGALVEARARASAPFGPRREGLLAAAREREGEALQLIHDRFDELADELTADGAQAAGGVDEAALAFLDAARERARCAQRIEALLQLRDGTSRFGDVALARSDVAVREVEAFVRAGGEIAPALQRRDLRQLGGLSAVAESAALA